MSSESVLAALSTPLKFLNGRRSGGAEPTNLTETLRCKFVAARPPLTLTNHADIVSGGRAEI